MIKEDFLHYLWKFSKIRNNIKASTGEAITVVSPGEHNHDAGPDFFNAQVLIDNQLWAGNVEIHVKASDWYVHNHENDDRYQNVILHVVWEDDVEVYLQESQLPTLALKHYISEALLQQYYALFDKDKQFINCEKQITQVPSFVVNNWKERSYFNRLEQKSKIILEELKVTNNNWEAVLYKMLLKNFGLKTNQDAFYSIANSLPFEVIRKCAASLQQLEALLFGQARLLSNNTDVYEESLLKEYTYLKHKYQLNEIAVLPVKFSRLRPLNFPTVRLAQFAGLYYNNHQLFANVLEAKLSEDFRKIFNSKTAVYWDTHYTFGKVSPKKQKKLSKSFVELLIINTFIPLKFCYAKVHGRHIEEEIEECLLSIGAETNTIISKFKELGVEVKSALDSQALLHTYKHFCKQHKCLQCNIGNHIIKQ
jgi:hypothetical protein